MNSDRHPPAEAVEPAWVDAVLRYWFEELTPAVWFTRNDAVDGQIRSRFLALHAQLAANPDLGAATPRAILAAVIVLDQFSRNLYRGGPQAFASDPIARQLARSAVEQRLDVSMPAAERMFLYLPFEHSEDREDQALSLRLFQNLGNHDWTSYAQAHKDLIDRFGRFPHRNAALNRRSTPDELAHLNDATNSF